MTLEREQAANGGSTIGLEKVGGADTTVAVLALASPMAGRCIPLSEVGDPMFAAEVLGGGVGILPTDGQVFSPITGMVTVVADTRHAVSLRSDDGGVEVLIHCGIDTVRMCGSPFVMHVKVGDHVEAGQLLLEADLVAIEAAGLKTDTPVIVTNSDAFASVDAINAGTDIAPGDPVIALRR